MDIVFVFRNKDYEVIGFNYNIVRSICRAMHKTCEHIVSYDYSFCWNSENSSPCTLFNLNRPKYNISHFVDNFHNAFKTLYFHFMQLSGDVVPSETF